MNKLVHIIALTLMMAFPHIAQAQRNKDISKKVYKTSSAPIKAKHVDITIVKVTIDEVDHNGSKSQSLDDIKSGRKKAKFIRIMVEYDFELTKAGKKEKKIIKQADGNYWINKLVFNWQVLFAQGNDGKPVKKESKGKSTYYNIQPDYALKMKKVVTYGNISSEGKSRYAMVFIEPNTMKRYMKNFKEEMFFTELTISLGGVDAVKLNAHGDKFHAVQSHSEDDTIKKTDQKLLNSFIPKDKKNKVSLFHLPGVKSIPELLLSRKDTPWATTSDPEALEFILKERKREED